MTQALRESFSFFAASAAVPVALPRTRYTSGQCWFEISGHQAIFDHAQQGMHGFTVQCGLNTVLHAYGTLDDALDLAASANADHGVKRTDQDLAFAVWTTYHRLRERLPQAPWVGKEVDERGATFGAWRPSSLLEASVALADRDLFDHDELAAAGRARRGRLRIVAAMHGVRPSVALAISRRPEG